MEQSSKPPPGSANAENWFGVDTVLNLTQPDAASYPVTTGIMNNGNKCVID